MIDSLCLKKLSQSFLCVAEVKVLEEFLIFFYHCKKSVAIENPCRAQTSYRDNPSCAHSALSCALPSLVVCAPRELLTRAQALSCQLCRDPAVPCRDMETFFHDQALSRHEILCLDNKPSYDDQTLSQHKTICHDIELFNLNDLLLRPKKILS